MTLYLVTMHWAPDCLWHGSRRNGLWTPTLISLYQLLLHVCQGENTAAWCWAGPKKQPLSKYCRWHVYKHTELCQESHSFKTSARSSQPTSFTFSSHYFFTCSSSSPWNWPLFLHSSPECRQSLFINNSNCIHSYLYVRQTLYHVLVSTLSNLVTPFRRRTRFTPSWSCRNEE